MLNFFTAGGGFAGQGVPTLYQVGRFSMTT